jgi:hypothetical protein
MHLSFAGAHAFDRSNYLGQGVETSFNSLNFLVSTTQAADQHSGLIPGRFVVALRSQSSKQSLGLPAPDSLQMDKAYLLRICSTLALPEQGALAQLCHRLVGLRLQDLQQDGCPEAQLALGALGFEMLACEVVGTFVKTSAHKLHFSSDVDLAPAVSYHLYRPNNELLELLINGGVFPANRIAFGMLRTSESLDYLSNPLQALVSMNDIRGKRSAMFGKTRMGKSNTVKLIIQGMLDATAQHRNVGQLIFDVNGEYANSNPQDGVSAIAVAYRDRCTCYYLTHRNKQADATGVLLRFNFYERTTEALQVMRELLPPEVASSDFVGGLLGCQLPEFARAEGEAPLQVFRRIRKLMLYWTVLDCSGFESQPERLKAMLVAMGMPASFNPGFTPQLRLAAYQAIRNSPPPAAPVTFAQMVSEFLVIGSFSKMYPNDPGLMVDGRYIFDMDEELMVTFLQPHAGTGTYVLRPCLPYHSPVATNFTVDVLERLSRGETVIIDLGSASQQIIKFFARSLSEAVFMAQERKFANNELNDVFVQIYFEEAHVIFPPNTSNVIDVYSRIAKEGAKFNIGFVYATQSPSTINNDLLTQTENFFIGHLSSELDVRGLATVQHAFKSVEERILKQRTAGLLHVLTYSHRYVVPIQANFYNGESRLVS